MYWVVLVSLLVCGGQLCQKQAVEDWRGREVSLLARVFSVWLISAVGLMGLGMAFWLVALQKLPVALAYPMLSLNFVWITLASRFFYREHSDWLHWLGIACIIAGIVCLGPRL